jgi:hypothetical protein
MDNKSALHFFRKRTTFLTDILIPRKKADGQTTAFLGTELEAIAYAIAALDFVVKTEEYDAAQR